MHFIAFCLPLFLFSYFFILGYPCLRLFYPISKSNNAYQNVLFMSPVMGFGILSLVVFTLNFSFSIPIARFALSANFILLFFAVAFMGFRRDFPHIFMIKKYIALLFVTYGLIGFPLLLHGFYWLSFSNDDMVNYSLGALRFFDHAFRELPDITQITQGKDASLLYWFLHVGHFTRAASELLLAYFYGILNINPLKLFMPVMVALQFCLVWVSPILINGTSSNAERKRPLLMLLCAVSSNLTLAFTSQLMAQIGGMALGILVLVSSREWIDHYMSKGPNCWRSNIFVALVISAFLIYYPELSPFIFLPLVCYSFTQFKKFNKQIAWREVFKGVGTVLAIVVVLLNYYILFVYHSLCFQLVSGVSTKVTALFPYFFTSSGLPAVWGISPLEGNPRQFFSWFTFIVGGVIALWILISTLILIRQKSIAAYFFLVALLTGLVFYFNHSGFAIFKLVMYAQPFVWAVLVESLYLGDYALIAMLSYGIILILQLVTQYHYLKVSTLNTAGSYAQIYQGSQLPIQQQLEFIAKHLKATKNAAVFLDTNNLPLMKMQLFYLRGIPTFDLTRTLMRSSQFMGMAPDYWLFKHVAAVNNLGNENILMWVKKNNFSFNLNGKTQNDTFFINKEALEVDEAHAIIIFSGPFVNIFNRSHFTSDELFKVEPYASAKNYLIFINSMLGEDYYLNDSGSSISLHQLQKDSEFRLGTCALMGKYLLVRAVHPTPKAKLLMELKVSSSRNMSKDEAKICVYGQQHNCATARFGTVTIFLPLPKPKIIDHIPYYLIAFMANDSETTIYARNISLVENKNSAPR